MQICERWIVSRFVPLSDVGFLFGLDPVWVLVWALCGSHCTVHFYCRFRIARLRHREKISDRGEREAENATQLSLSLFLSLTPPRRRVGDSDCRRRFAGEVWFPCSGEFVLWCVRSPACAFAFCSVESSPLVFV